MFIFQGNNLYPQNSLCMPYISDSLLAQQQILTTSSRIVKFGFQVAYMSTPDANWARLIPQPWVQWGPSAIFCILCIFAISSAGCSRLKKPWMSDLRCKQAVSLASVELLRCASEISVNDV